MGAVTDASRRRAAEDLRRIGASAPHDMNGAGSMVLVGRIGEAAGVHYAPYEWTPDEVCSALADLIDPVSDARDDPGGDPAKRVRHLEYLLDGAERKAERRRRHILMCEASNSKLKEQIRREHAELLDIARRIDDMPARFGDTALRASQLGAVADRIRRSIRVTA